jgi:hypothetical protein
VYDLPHFDFHFYTVPVEVRNSILPSDPQYATKAANYPTADYRRRSTSMRQRRRVLRRRRSRSR